MNIQEIKECIPHRYPFLFVDKVLSIEENKIIALKNVTINENFFQGHFPYDPIMPGVLLVEGLAQCGAILMMKGMKFEKKVSPYFTGLDRVRFKRPVRPGDQIIYEVELLQQSSRMVNLKGVIFVDQKLAVSIDQFSAMIVSVE